MIIPGLLMPFFMFCSFSVKREMAAAQGVARLLVTGVLLGSFSFSALRSISGSIPTRNTGDVQMPGTPLRWGLLSLAASLSRWQKWEWWRERWLTSHH